jgi:hypothetical protein
VERALLALLLAERQAAGGGGGAVSQMGNAVLAKLTASLAAAPSDADANWQVQERLQRQHVEHERRDEHELRAATARQKEAKYKRRLGHEAGAAGSSADDSPTGDFPDGARDGASVPPSPGARFTPSTSLSASLSASLSGADVRLRSGGYGDESGRAAPVVDDDELAGLDASRADLKLAPLVASAKARLEASAAVGAVPAAVDAVPEPPEADVAMEEDGWRDEASKEVPSAMEVDSAADDGLGPALPALAALGSSKGALERAFVRAAAALYDSSKMTEKPAEGPFNTILKTAVKVLEDGQLKPWNPT